VRDEVIRTVSVRSVDRRQLFRTTTGR
jgi:hypothetical protein